MNIVEWWEQAHKFTTKKWLTGSGLWQYLELFDAEELYKDAKYILEIGCGTCVATKQMSEDGKLLTVLDISRQALKNARPWAGCILPSEIHLLPTNYYDLAISHLVAQHMNDVDLTHQLHYVIKSLADKGRLLLQFADAKTHPKTFTLEHEQKGGVVRWPEDMNSIIKDCGGQIINLTTKKINDNVTWYAAHIIKV